MHEKPKFISKFAQKETLKYQAQCLQKQTRNKLRAAA